MEKRAWFKALDIAVFVNCIVECFELYGASCSIVGLNILITLDIPV
jgi:hypothetical protein